MGLWLPLAAMVVVQLGYAVMNIVSKVALEAGMDALVLTAYRQIVASFVTAPLALWLERPMIRRINKQILVQTFLCSIFGATGNILLYFVGLKFTSPTIGCALNNTLPAFTFIFALLFRLERVGIRSGSGQAKIIGTAVCIGGAMLLSFYHGREIQIGKSKLTWNYAAALGKGTDATSSGGGHSVLGSFLVIGSNLCWAIWFILQAKMGQTFDAPYTSTALMSIMSAVQCTCVALIWDHGTSAWAPSPTIRLVAGLYGGAIGSGLGFCLMTWAIRQKGPLYVSVFSPLLLVLVAFFSWALLREKLYVGTIVGSVLIVAGLYAVLWGKSKETKAIAVHPAQLNLDLELQPNGNPNHS